MASMTDEFPSIQETGQKNQESNHTKMMKLETRQPNKENPERVKTLLDQLLNQQFVQQRTHL